MTTLMIIFCIAISAILVFFFIAAWRHDIRLESFRKSIEIGQQVTYFRVFYSRNEDDNDYGSGIITGIEGDNITVMCGFLEKVQVSRKDLYPTDF